jgi:hypothetical protein
VLAGSVGAAADDRSCLNGALWTALGLPQGRRALAGRGSKTTRGRVLTSAYERWRSGPANPYGPRLPTFVTYGTPNLMK